MTLRALAELVLAAALAACTPAAPKSDAEVESSDFPAAHRPEIAPIVSNRYSTEEARDRLREADNVMTRSGVARSMTVADIGAGEGQPARSALPPAWARTSACSPCRAESPRRAGERA